MANPGDVAGTEKIITLSVSNAFGKKRDNSIIWM